MNGALLSSVSDARRQQIAHAARYHCAPRSPPKSPISQTIEIIITQQ